MGLQYIFSQTDTCYKQETTSKVMPLRSVYQRAEAFYSSHLHVMEEATTGSKF